MNRDIEHERHIVGVAARAAGFASLENGQVVVWPAIAELNALSDARAHPGEVVLEGRPVRLLDEVAEELADARSYLVWEIQSVLDEALAGDPAALAAYGTALTALTHLLAAWSALTSP